jgi:hypothetical protein
MLIMAWGFTILNSVTVPVMVTSRSPSNTAKKE